MGANLTPKKTLLFTNNAIGEDAMKTMKSSCVYLYGTFVTNEEEPAAGKKMRVTN